ncbi:putative small heat shock protein [Methanosalsum zhilinae DSM 4017]|uniref:Putative small heat shock protein n=1 Tax=Methanosalsum zhilinae (strain DSM 4017 / NBRC 107636 / OCM 62 / WeN5) TaxID=679901 RepID=F7XKU1_METZD|nr:Hsp20/alpha crystallin family protein [Methanosalsum zhilinae]AEH61806.1 putative small heat shock protein [Methanosalsum zhilinae DSM 4017]
MTEIIQSPSVYECSDESNRNLNIEIKIPGVKKENVVCQINENSFSLRTVNGEDKIGGTYPIFCPVDAKRAICRYSNGKIIITAPKWA